MGMTHDHEDVEAATSNIERPADPIVGAFLDLMASDLEAHPERLGVVPGALLARAKELTEGLEIDHDSLIEGATTL